MNTTIRPTIICQQCDDVNAVRCTGHPRGTHIRRNAVPCRYCALPVAEECDAETGDVGYPLDDGSGRYAAHWSCVWEAKDGAHVVTLTNTVSGRMTWHRYTTRARALEMGATYREWNLREWACGRNLDITVTSEGESTWATESTHLGHECDACQAAIASAVAIAKCTGSTGATHTDGQHVAKVERRDVEAVSF